MANCRGPNCGNGKALPLDMLIERFGPDYEIVGETRIAAACKCDRCHHRGAQIHMMTKTASSPYRAASEGK